MQFFSLQNSQKYPTITLSKHSEVHVSEVITCHHVAMRRRNCVFVWRQRFYCDLVLWTSKRYVKLRNEYPLNSSSTVTFDWNIYSIDFKFLSFRIRAEKAMETTSSTFAAFFDCCQSLHVTFILIFWTLPLCWNILLSFYVTFVTYVTLFILSESF